MRIKMVFGMFLSLLAATPAFAVRTIMYYENECCRPITEGEFAILYCQGLTLQEPLQGWTVQTAAAALSTLGHQPAGGWVLSRFLSEAVMSRLLRNSPFYRQPFTEEPFQKSDKLVTVANARSVVPSDQSLTQGEFAILLALALRLPVPADCSAQAAIEALSSLNVPIRPAMGWQPNTPLREAEMIQILAPTEYRPTSLEASMEVSPLQAYSLLFGKYEIATQGHFGLFVVNVLGTPPPPGGWTTQKALDFVKSEFHVEGGYGWNAHAPLCAEVFEYALRQILMTVRLSMQPAAASDLASAAGARPGPGRIVTTSAPATAPTPEPVPAAHGAGEVEAFISEVRRGGLMPSDPCAIVPIQGLVRLESPIPPPPPPLFPASSGSVSP